MMKQEFPMTMHRILFVFLLSLAGAGQALAESALLADKSVIRFISVKNASVAEVHHFTSLSGTIDGGRVEVVIPLVDVETLIPIRNERMRKMLFETEVFPKASLTGRIDMDAVMALDSGEYTDMKVDLNLDLHGHRQPVTATVSVARLGDEIHVNTEQPIVLNAGDFELSEGIERLREVAGLKNIATQVPVTATLVFSR
jgi:hypothetical protein